MLYAIALILSLAWDESVSFEDHSFVTFDMGWIHSNKTINHNSKMMCCINFDAPIHQILLRLPENNNLNQYNLTHCTLAGLSLSRENQ
jgi:hypothetical protein